MTRQTSSRHTSMTKKSANLAPVADIYRMITTMDGVPVTKSDGSIMLFGDTRSCRYNAKTRTFQTRQRHHSRGLTRHQYFLAVRQYRDQGKIDFATLGRKGD